MAWSAISIDPGTRCFVNSCPAQQPTPDAAHTTGPGALSRINAVVHVGFAVLLVASLVRYGMRHSPADNVGVLVLATAACGLYALTAALSLRRPRAVWLFVLGVEPRAAAISTAIRREGMR